MLVVRRTNSDGTSDYLPISRINRMTDRPFSVQLEWVGDIKRQNITMLNDFYRIIGGTYERMNRSRCHDWNYLAVETLRAFSIIANGAVILQIR